MADSCEHMNGVFYHNEGRSAENNSFTFTHLRPLSVYSHMVCRSQIHSSGSVCNIQVQITNKTGYKRRMEDSCLDETCETPIKKPRFESRSPDQGCVVDSLDFLTGVQESTPVQTLIISKDFTPPRSKVVQPVMSTPLFQRRPKPLDQAWESFPSPIPVLNRTRDNPSLNVSLTGCLGSGKGERRKVSYVHFPVYECRRHGVTPEETAVRTEGGGVSAQQQEESLQNETTERCQSPLPLQLQVKSKVFVPQTTKTVCQSAESHEKPKCVINRKTHDPDLSEEVWQRQKTTYVASVKRHMREGNRAGNGVMTELHHLMNTVAGQQSGSNREQWQHPSDLTHRNYGSCVGGPLLSLSEWQNKNFLTHRRFARVPDIFYRSPFL